MDGTCKFAANGQAYAIGMGNPAASWRARTGNRSGKTHETLRSCTQSARDPAPSGLNQEQFWTQIGVTQSGGSRYESGREMPKPVRELLRLVHVEQVDLSQVKRVDFEIISYLKTSHPELYRSLRRAVRSRQPTPTSPRKQPSRPMPTRRRAHRSLAAGREACRRPAFGLIRSPVRTGPGPAARLAGWNCHE